MEELKRIQAYVEEHRAGGADEFARRYTTAMLLRREASNDDSEAAFHTAFMSRDDMFRETSERAAAPPSTAPPRSERLTLAEKPKAHAGEVIPVAKRAGGAFLDRIGVGRARNADVCLPLPRVSKYHAYFSCDEKDRWTVTDAGSKNGTWLDGARIEARAPMSLVDGAEISFGPYRFIFYTPAGFVDMVGRRASLR